MLPAPLSDDAVLPFETGAPVEPAEPDLPGVSLVIPILNAGPFLERTLRSLLLNDLTGVEVIVRDGGSTDETPRILEHYRAACTRIVSERDTGQADAINKGFAVARGPILSWLNGDDLLLPGSLNAIRRVFRDDPSADVVVGDAALTELDLSPIHHYRPARLDFAHLLDYATNHLVQPAVFFTARAFAAVGPLKESLHYAMDADLFLAMAQRFGMRRLHRDVALSVYHEACKTRRQRAESIAELALVQARHGGFAEAAKTLQILVDLHNAAARAPRAAGSGDSVLARRLAAVEAEVEKSRALLLGTGTGTGTGTGMRQGAGLATGAALAARGEA